MHVSKGGAVNTEARGRSAVAGHCRMRKYQLNSSLVDGVRYWRARVPYGTYNTFETRDLAILWLTTKHEERVLKAERRERAAEDARRRQIESETLDITQG